jgi:hypothetical protein
MHIDLDIIIRLADRFGTPLVLLGALLWLSYLFIRGPATVLAKSLGEGFGSLCKAGIGYLGEATKKLEGLPSHVSLEAAGVRETVRAEGSATRSHVTEVVEKLRDRVSTAENEIGNQVRAATGSQPVLPPTPATGATGAPKGPA